MLVLFWVFGDQTGAAENPLIRRLQVQGTQRPVHLETRAGEPLERACVARDLRRLWASGWFDDIRVEVSGEPDAVEVVFYVVERPRYYLRRIKFEPASASRPVEIEPGTAMDKQRVHQIAVELQNQWLEQGYSDAEVHGEIVPVGLRQADLHLRLKLGRRYRVQEVRFSGTLGLNSKELVQGLRYTRSRRILPRLPGVWNGWQSHPAFSQQRLEAELESLRSLYFSRGYWNAAVTLDGLTFDEGEATVSLQVQSGPRHEISRAQVFGGAPGKEFSSSLRDAPVQALCHCLEQARRDSEKEGKLNFSVQMEVRPAAQPESPTDTLSRSQPEKKQMEKQWISLAASIETGPPYTVRRIEFRGNHNFSDLTLRRMLLLNEGDLFDYSQFRRSLVRLNRLGVFMKITEDRARIVPDPATRQVDVTLELKETPRGRWGLSGSLEPLSLLRPLRFSLESRLPSWGSGTLELSTYFVSLGLFPFAQPILPAAWLHQDLRWQPLIAVSRPYLPGQGWRSGLVVAPQFGWRGTAAGSALIQAQRGVLALEGNSDSPPRLAIPVWWRDGEAHSDPGQPRFTGSLVCEAERRRFFWIGSAGLAALNKVLTLSAF